MKTEINEHLKQKLKKIRCWLLDMDGTVSLENEALPGAVNFFSAITFCYLVIYLFLHYFQNRCKGTKNSLIRLSFQVKLLFYHF